jgi:single-stranded-DNA-specific exonuclease
MFASAQALAGAPPSPSSALELSRALSVSLTLATWLDARGFRDLDATRRFLSPRLAELSPPHAMLDRDAAAERIARAVTARERIAVFGDYDCDGITATAVLTELLRALDADVTPLVAERHDGGYGVSPAAVARIVATGATLVVTCDCGSSDHASLAELRRRGIDAVVIDHHLVPDEPLPVVAFLNPQRPGCGFPFKWLASCGLCLSVGAAVRARLGRTIDLTSVLDLVAIGSIADVVPLVGDNRALVRAGLARLGDVKRPGLRALFELAKLERGTPLRADEVAFRIAPRLNAPGRLGSAAVTLALLLEKNQDRADQLAGDVEQKNAERRVLQDRMVAEALAEVREQRWDEAPAVVIGREGWQHGIVGIVAGRLADDLGRPVAVIGFEGGVGRGSVRGPRGSRLYDALKAVSSVLGRFGGHQAAAGLEVSMERLGELREGFAAAVAAQGPDSTSAPAAPCVSLAAGDTLARVLGDFALLEPCGEGNPSPELELAGRLVRAREVRGGHLKLEVELGSGERVSAFGAGMGERTFEPGANVALAGSLVRDRFRGGDAAEIRLTRVA